MTAFGLILNSFYLLNLYIIWAAHGVNIQAYRHFNFTGLVWESNSTASCYSIPEDERSWVLSFRTDTCFIGYNFGYCSPLRSQKIMPGNKTLGSGQDLQAYSSFHVCNEKEGGGQLNVDIIKHIQHVHHRPDVLYSYRNVCSCVNVPQSVQNMEKWSIDNHHNILYAYYEPNCSETNWNSIFLKAGFNSNNDRVLESKKTDSLTSTTYKIQSFGPDRNSAYFQTSCSSSLVPTTTTTERTKTFERTTEREMSMDAVLDKRFQLASNQILRMLQANLTYFQSDIRKQQTSYFTKLTDAFAEQLKQKLRNFTEKIKSDLDNLFA